MMIGAVIDVFGVFLQVTRQTQRLQVVYRIIAA